MNGAVQSIITSGASGIIVDIECRLSNNLPMIVIVGSASRAVGESKERIRGAFASSHIMLPRKRITVNLAPADIPKGDSGFDLAIAVAILQASGDITLPASSEAGGQAFIGELGLDGRTRAIRGLIGKLLAGRERGLTTFYIPAANLRQAELVPHVRLVPIDSLAQLHGYLSGAQSYTVLDTGGGRPVSVRAAPERAGPSLDDIVGQDQAKRALQIAAGGGHNLLLNGPPGTGKSMLAKALPGLLPPLSREETLEVTQLHSLAGYDYGKLVTERPFRAPHHSASQPAITGGGAQLRPGEISLAHRGVLFFDELPEFRRETLEALRQPLEDRHIAVARLRETVTYPANFIFLATANPCPCGHYGTNKACSCRTNQIAQYRNHLSGPIMDRIDLHSSVHGVDHDRLLEPPEHTQEDEAYRRRIAAARQMQAKRFGTADRLNADMTNDELKLHAKLGSAASSLLTNAAKRLNLSARGYMRTVRVARTIADLEGSEDIHETHLSEALAYRPQIRPLTSDP